MSEGSEDEDLRDTSFANGDDGGALQDESDSDAALDAEVERRVPHGEVERAGSKEPGVSEDDLEDDEDADDHSSSQSKPRKHGERNKQSGPLNDSRSKTPPPGPQQKSRSLSPETYPRKSAIPEYARTPSREKRMRSTWRVKTPVLQVVDSDREPPVAIYGPNTKKAPTSMAEMSSYWKQKKMLAVPLRRNTSQTKPVLWTEELEPPEHLQHWNNFEKRATREDFLIRYSDHYKSIDPEKWSTNDLFAFIADSMVREDQVDSAGVPLSTHFLEKVGRRRVESRVDVVLLQAVLALRLDGRKFIHASAFTLADMLPVSDFEVEDLKGAIKQYVELNAQHKTVTATAGEAMSAATEEQRETVQVQELLLSEVRVRTGRAKLRELRESLEPLQKRVAAGQEDYVLIQGYLSRPRTPEQQVLSRPGSAALFKMRRHLRSDLEQSQGRCEELMLQEKDMERTVRQMEEASLQVRDAVNKSRSERRERRAALKEEQQARAAEEWEEKLHSMAAGDELLLDAERYVAKASVEADDRNRAMLLSSSREKVQAARAVYEGALAVGERRRRLSAVEQLVGLEEEKRAGCERALEVAKRHVFNANGAGPGDTDTAWRYLRHAREALEEARAAATRTGALPSMAGRVGDVEERLLDAERRWGLGSRASAGSAAGEGRPLSQRSNLNGPGPSRSGSAGGAGSRRSEESRPVSRGSSHGGSRVGRLGSEASQSGTESEGGESAAQTDFQEQLTKLIHEKQKEVVENVADSLCGMQAWLFELKAKRKARASQELPAVGEGSLASNAESAVSTRPASPG